jgi:pimeloyl-ACP methyl ester carboxylesterase
VLPWLRDYDIRYVDPRDTLDVAPDEIVVGHSLGAMRAAEYAAKHDVRRLVLVAPAGLHGPRLFGLLGSTAPSFYPRVALDALRWGPFALLRGGVDAWRTRLDPTAIRAPTLIVWGERDRLVPARLATDWHKAIPGSRLELIAGARHVPMVERPSAFAEVLLDFLRDEPGVGVVDGVRADRQLDEPPAR